PCMKPAVTNSQFIPRINTTTINSIDILDVPVRTNILPDGSEIERSFVYDNKIISLNNQFHEEFLKICLKISNSKEFKFFISIDFIKATSFYWIQNKYISKLDLDFTTFFEEQVASKVKNYKTWFPISNFFIEENFSIGDVDFQEVTEELVETWYFKDTDEDNKKLTDTIKLMCEKDKKELKGYAMGVVKVKAEPKLVKNISIEKLDIVLSILRIFEGVIFQPNKKSYCVPKGLENKEASISYITDYQDCLIYKEEILPSSHPLPFKLDKVSLNEIINFEGFKLIDKILKSDSMTPFQETCLNSFIIYSQSSLKRNISDKIIYIY
ncbi:MAG: hypothetical protein WBG30_05200, partial [Psychrilyobacter sp.]|uniref:hypothetical protein n=1 Tax=Psychrilyobacter sp. TaxID=2586924 RepID=UPI003C7884A9